MREIKFRGFTLLTKEWVYGVPVLHVNGAAYMLEHSVEGFSEAPILGEIDPRSLGQYTGLKDKSGQEVYEGDIIEWKEAKYYSFSIAGGLEERDTKEAKKEASVLRSVVRFRDGEFFFSPNIPLRVIANTEYHYTVKTWCSEDRYVAFDFKVIGNIYENPELIEEE